jgi:acetyl esterase/lipase
MTSLGLPDLTDIREGLSLPRQVRIVAGEWVRRHAASACLLVPLLVLIGAVHAIGMWSFPRWVDDPGTYLSQAWSLQYQRALSPYSYIYDHAPAGWIQLSLWSMLTDGFNRYDSAIGFGSECIDLRASPLRAPRLVGQPPTMIVTAGFDPLRDEGRAYADRLREAGVDVLYREYPGQIHAFVSLTKAIPQGMACTLEIAEYLRRRLQ